MKESKISREAPTKDAREALGRLRDENALLRAALAEARAQLSELEQMPGSDPLTALVDARQFHAELSRVLSGCTRHNSHAALLTVEIDDLKSINERYGRVAGDATLRDAARLLRGLIRGSDVAARNGAATFSLLLDRLDADSAIDTADRIGRCIAAHRIDLGSTEIKVRATVSAATILPGDTVEEVVRRAARNHARLKEMEV